MLSDLSHSIKTSFIEAWSSITKNTLECFIDLETTLDDHTLCDNKGDLITMLRVDGCKGLPGPAELENIIASATNALSGFMSTPGHSLEVVYSRNPVISPLALEQLMQPAQDGARINGLAIDDILLDRSQTLGKFLGEETLLICCWSHVNGLTKEEQKENRRTIRDNNKKWPWTASRIAQNIYAATDILLPSHEGFVNSVIEGLSLDGKGVVIHRLDVRDAIREIRKAIQPHDTWDDWMPHVRSDPLRPVMPKSDDLMDQDCYLWKKLAHQVADVDFTTINSTTIQGWDNRLWAPLDMTLGPIEHKPFNVLVAHLNKHKVPFRISFLIEGGATMWSKNLIASLIPFASSTNRLIIDAIEEQNSKSLRGEAIVAMRCSMTTWCDDGSLDTLRRNSAHLKRAIRAWGRAEVTEKVGDPLEAFFASVPAVSCTSTGTPYIPDLQTTLGILPLQRPACPLTRGTHIFRTKDGKPYPFVPDKGMSPFVFDIVFANPGMGKSVLLNSMTFSGLLSAKSSQLPYVAILDIGPSSSGLISLIRAALPPDQKSQAQHIRLKNEKSMAVNPLDTQLGFRFPLSTEKSFINGLLGLLVSGPNEPLSKDMSDLISHVAEESYQAKSNLEDKYNGKLYRANVCISVDEALKKHGFIPDDKSLWWDVVDFLFLQREVTQATRAQRYAVPVLDDLIVSARRDTIKNIYGAARITDEPIIEVFCRRITSIKGKYPLLSSYTVFDIGNARICALDLMDVTPNQTDEDKHNSAIMYMFARHLLVHHWWFDRDMTRTIGKYAPDIYTAYHDRRVKSLLDMPKRLCYDEFHRTANAKAIRDQVVRDARETRKMNVQLVMASQNLSDFDPEMIFLASGIWVLGVGMDSESPEKIVKTFGLNETAKAIIKYDLKVPNKEGASVLSVSGSLSNRYEQLIYNTLGAIELWAFSTTPDDVVLRSALYERMGSDKARKALAKAYPSGTAKSEIEKRYDLLISQGETSSAQKEDIISELVLELEKSV